MDELKYVGIMKREANKSAQGEQKYLASQEKKMSGIYCTVCNGREEDCVTLSGGGGDLPQLLGTCRANIIIFDSPCGGTIVGLVPASIDGYWVMPKKGATWTVPIDRAKHPDVYERLNRYRGMKTYLKEGYAKSISDVPVRVLYFDFNDATEDKKETQEDTQDDMLKEIYEYMRSMDKRQEAMAERQIALEKALGGFDYKGAEI